MPTKRNVVFMEEIEKEEKKYSKNQGEVLVNQAALPIYAKTDDMHLSSNPILQPCELRKCYKDS